jgi:hypothetical protein
MLHRASDFDGLFGWMLYIYCTMFVYFNPTMTPNVQCWGHLTILLHVYVICHFWTPICNVLGYWRHRSISFTSLFTTPLVVTTISLYSVLWPSNVVSWSGPLISSVICSVISLQCSYLGVSSISVSISASLLSLSLSRCLFYVCLFISVSLLSLSLSRCLFYVCLFISVYFLFLSLSRCLFSLYPSLISVTVAFSIAPVSNNLFA